VSDPVEAWADALEALIARLPGRLATRAVVVAKTDSTQDAARRLSGGRPGLVLVAGRQSAGRGRLGRAWADTAQLGLAMTLVLDAGGFDPGHLSAAAGVGACRAVRSFLEPSPGRARLRWPNDVVESSIAGARPRKIAGVLVEGRGPLLLLGVGVNVAQSEHDWPPGLGEHAVSLAQLGASPSRLDVALRVLEELDAACAAGAEALSAAWNELDVTVGTRCAFIHAGRRFAGRVESIAPTSELILRTDSGLPLRLPAFTTSMCHDGAAG
jgi:BirA family biotin operon repressor/biotin-[acetyl-CoA-carboxylase] ligase